MKSKSTIINTILIIVGLTSILAAIALASASEIQEKKVKVSQSELPAVIKNAIEQTFPDVEVLSIEKEVEGEDPGQYDVLIRSGQKEYEVEISPEGKVIESKEAASEEDDTESSQARKWTETFGQENCTFLATGRNRFFSLEPGHELVLQSSEEKVVITVLNETRRIGNVETRIIEEREEKDGKLAEVSRNFFVICKEHGDVFYFGEEVDDYEDGRIVGHSGAWRADEANCKAGIIMPGTVLLGARHYQEIAPNAMDRAEIISDDVTMTTPAGTFRNCIKVEETSGLDPDEKCYKTYAPGVGLIQDEDLLLIRYRKAEEQPLSLKDLPRAVRATLRKCAKGGKITEIEMDTADGIARYEAEIIRDGKVIDILISTKGEYLGIEDEEEVEEDLDKNDDDN